MFSFYTVVRDPSRSIEEVSWMTFRGPPPLHHCKWGRCSGGHSKAEPPGSIPNPEVKRFSADGSVAIGHVRVGRCQVKQINRPVRRAVFLCPDFPVGRRQGGVGDRSAYRVVLDGSPGSCVNGTHEKSSPTSVSFRGSHVAGRSHASIRQRFVRRRRVCPGGDLEGPVLQDPQDRHDP